MEKQSWSLYNGDAHGDDLLFGTDDYRQYMLDRDSSAEGTQDKPIESTEPTLDEPA